MSSNLEIERKFLVKGVLDLSNTPFTIIEQFYLPITSTSSRIRLTYNPAGKLISSIFATKSSDPALIRLEQETELSTSHALEWIAHYSKSCVRKRRYLMYGTDGTKFEIDVFKDIELILVEVELVDAYQPFIHPTWLGIEVTGNPSYYNQNLAIEV